MCPCTGSWIPPGGLAKMFSFKMKKVSSNILLGSNDPWNAIHTIKRKKNEKKKTESTLKSLMTFEFSLHSFSRISSHWRVVNL